MAKVYIIQEVKTIDPTTGQMVTTMSFEKAKKFGELVTCCSSGRIGFTPAPTVYALKNALKDFCDDDYIVPVGDPSLIAIAGAVAASVNRGRFNILKWDRRTSDYISVTVEMYKRKGII